MKIDIKFCFVLLCVVFEEMLCSESLLLRKPQYFALSSCFSFVYLLCVGIPILKIVLSLTHKWVLSDSFA